MAYSQKPEFHYHTTTLPNYQTITLSHRLTATLKLFVSLKNEHFPRIAAFNYHISAYHCSISWAVEL